MWSSSDGEGDGRRLRTRGEASTGSHDHPLSYFPSSSSATAVVPAMDDGTLDVANIVQGKRRRKVCHI